MAGAVVLVAWAAGCGSGDRPFQPTEDPVGQTLQPIQGGTTDSTHNFAVGILQFMPSGSIAICSGVLLAPNLVATARHCVSRLASSQIDCATSAFAGTLPAADMFVTSSPDLQTATTRDLISVISGDSGDDGIIVPSPASVCGNDLALLILSQPISVPEYVTPVISPPMTDHQAYATSFTAIGYGVDTPTDTTGESAGIRRIKEDVNIGCIPNDPIPANCYSDPSAAQFITPNEFEGGDGTCEGDSGSGAFDQASFDNGNWFAFGVLSRGGVSPEGGTCEGSIYTRFDAWGPLIVGAANKAAALGGYAPPSWAVSTGQPAADAGSSAVSCLANGSACDQDTDCCAVNCITYNGGQTASCFACDPQHTCNLGYGCQGGVCIFGATSVYDAGVTTTSMAVESGGCTAGLTGGGSSAPGRTVAAGLAIAAIAARRRRRAPGATVRTRR